MDGDIFGKASQARENWNTAVAEEETNILGLIDMVNTMENEENKGIGQHVNIQSAIGDYVNYNALEGLTEDSLTSYVSILSTHNYKKQSYTVESNPSWKILGEDNNGKILITTADPILSDTGSKFNIQGTQTSYINGIIELDRISGLYGQGTYADKSNSYTYTYKDTNNLEQTKTVVTGGRSIRVEDVSAIQPFNPTQTVNGYGFVWKFSLEKGEEDDDYYVYYTLNGVKNKGTGNYKKMWYYDYTSNIWKLLENNENIDVTCTDTGDNYYLIGNSSKELKMLRYKDNPTGITDVDTAYWLASRSCQPRETGTIQYGIMYIASGAVHGGTFEYQNNSTTGYAIAIRPVVTLANGVILTEQDENGVWQLGVE